ncbi:MAG: DMT family transporter [Gemmatimonadota bacterium]
MINAAPAAPSEHPYAAHAALLAMALIWGVNFTASKLALEQLSPLAFNALRFPMAALLLLVVLRRAGPIELPARSELPRVIALGLFGNLLYQLCFIFGLDRTSAANASLLLAGTPVVTAVMTAALGQERIRAPVWFGVVATTAGVALIVLGSARVAPEGTLTGNLLMLGAIVMWTFYTVGGKPLVDRHGPVAVTAWTLWIGSAGLLLAGVPDLLRVDFRALSLLTWACVGYAGILSIGIAYMFYYYGVSRLGNARTGAYSNLVPVFALLAAWLWLAQPPRLFQLIGAAVILGGVTVAQYGTALRKGATGLRYGTAQYGTALRDCAIRDCATGLRYGTALRDCATGLRYGTALRDCAYR